MCEGRIRRISPFSVTFMGRMDRHLLHCVTFMSWLAGGFLRIASGLADPVALSAEGSEP
jgi:hypothetical protein